MKFNNAWKTLCYVFQVNGRTEFRNRLIQIIFRGEDDDYRREGCEDGLRLVDFDAGTVTATAGKREDYVISATGPALTDNDVLDFAEYFETKAEAFSGHFWTTLEVDLAVGFEPKVAAFSGRPCLPNSGGRRSRYQGELSKISGGIWSA
ncbi:hypothetical protein [Rhizobium leguminosarum]|uniref:hypothetical protein n=1 Tax=Rhizobium leguminosarum TaxID=384 RepID=UPI0014412CA9|nr:hypothetical protein [Rhizobium leguminosarum]NKM01806.1 hypothetical protein [Rhizobium leguminosarum bv. viciae]